MYQAGFLSFVTFLVDFVNDDRIANPGTSRCVHFCFFICLLLCGCSSAISFPLIG